MVAEAQTLTRQALCCECGRVRTVSARHSPRNYVPEGSSPEHIATMMGYAPGYWSKIPPWERMLEDLRCATCKRVTRHAMLRSEEDPYRDTSEEENGRPRNLTLEDALGLLRSLGVAVGFDTSHPEVIASVAHRLSDGHIWAWVNPDSDEEVLRRTLGRIAEYASAPDEHKWYLYKDDEGRHVASIEWQDNQRGSSR